jgi:hypothetical protein
LKAKRLFIEGDGCSDVFDIKNGVPKFHIFLLRGCEYELRPTNTRNYPPNQITNLRGACSLNGGILQAIS